MRKTLRQGVIFPANFKPLSAGYVGSSKSEGQDGQDLDRTPRSHKISTILLYCFLSVVLFIPDSDRLAILFSRS